MLYTIIFLRVIKNYFQIFENVAFLSMLFEHALILFFIGAILAETFCKKGNGKGLGKMT